jgi:hypothetical protein
MPEEPRLTYSDMAQAEDHHKLHASWGGEGAASASSCGCDITLKTAGAFMAGSMYMPCQSSFSLH